MYKEIVLIFLILFLVNTANAATPVITIVSIDEIYENSTGDFSIVWGITHDSVGLNTSSLAMLWTSYNNVTESYKHSIRPPCNDRANDYGPNGAILRAENRNDTLNFENNATITDGNIWKWAGADENSTKLNIVNVNSTYTLVYYNCTYQCTTFNTMYYLDRQDMFDSLKTTVKIQSSNEVVIKLYDPLIMQGHNRDFIVRMFVNSAVIGNPTDVLEAWWANSSWDPTGVIDVTDSPYATLITTFNETSWIDYSYSPVNNNYIEIVTHGNATEGIIPGNESWLVLRTDAVSGSHCYGLNVTNDITSTNVSYADTNVLLESGSYVSYTPNLFICQIDSDEFITKLYVADNNGDWGNLTVNETIRDGYFDPSKVGFLHFNFEGHEDETMDCTYRENMGICLQVSTDPDGGLVNHNLTLHKSNGDLVAIINDTFTNLDAGLTGCIDINLDTSAHYSTSDMYTLKCIATDNEYKTSVSELTYNFSLSPLTTSANIIDNDRLVFWGYNDVPALYIAVGDDDIISLSGGIYTFHKGIHMSQYLDTFLIDENIHIVSIDNISTPYLRLTGMYNITGVEITSWKAGVPAPQTDEFRAYIYSDNHYSNSSYIINSNMSYLGRGLPPLNGIYLQGLSGTLIDNNVFSYNDMGIVLRESDNFVLSNNTIYGIPEYNIHVWLGVENTIRDNIIIGASKIGILMEENNDTVILNNIISDMTGKSIKINKSNDIDICGNNVYYTGFSETGVAIDLYNDVNNINISNNLIEGGQIGIYSRDATNIDILGNIIYNVQYGATQSMGSNYFNISNNHITAVEDHLGNPGVGILMMYGENVVKNNIISVSDGRGIWIWGYCDNSVFENNSITLTDDSFYCYMLDNGATGIEILNPADDVFSVKVANEFSTTTIKNTDGQIFRHTSNHTSYGYTSGIFQLYVNHPDTFIVEQYDYTMGFTSTSNITSHVLNPGNLARFTINSGIVGNVNVSNVAPGTYNLNDFVWNIQESALATGGNVEFVDNLFVGSYMVVSNDTSLPVISDIIVYNIGDDAASIRWNINKECANLIYYDTDENNVIIKNCSVSEWDNMTAAPNIRIIDLMPNTEYFYQLYSEDHYNNSNLSLVGTFTTGMSNDQMPLAIYILIVIIVFALMGTSIVLRGNERYIDVVAALLAAFMAFMTSNLAINGKVYTSETVYNGLPIYNVLHSLPLHYLLLLIGVIMILYTVFMVIEVIIQSYENLTDI